MLQSRINFNNMWKVKILVDNYVETVEDAIIMRN